MGIKQKYEVFSTKVFLVLDDVDEIAKKYNEFDTVLGIFNTIINNNNVRAK